MDKQKIVDCLNESLGAGDSVLIEEFARKMIKDPNK